VPAQDDDVIRMEREKKDYKIVT